MVDLALGGASLASCYGPVVFVAFGCFDLANVLGATDATVWVADSVSVGYVGGTAISLTSKYVSK